MDLFGTLFQSECKGAAAGGPPPVPVGKSAYARAVGNTVTIQSLDPKGPATRTVVGSNTVTALAAWQSDSDGITTVAYACRYSPVVHLVEFAAGSSDSTAPVPALKASAADVVALTFCGNGLYLVALTGVPNFALQVWNWRDGALLNEFACGHAAAALATFPGAETTWIAAGGDAESGVSLFELQLSARSAAVRRVDAQTRGELVQEALLAHGRSDTARKLAQQLAEQRLLPLLTAGGGAPVFASADASPLGALGVVCPNVSGQLLLQFAAANGAPSVLAIAVPRPAPVTLLHPGDVTLDDQALAETAPRVVTPTQTPLRDPNASLWPRPSRSVAFTPDTRPGTFDGTVNVVGGASGKSSEILSKSQVAGSLGSIGAAAVAASSSSDTATGIADLGVDAGDAFHRVAVCGAVANQWLVVTRQGRLLLLDASARRANLVAEGTLPGAKSVAHLSTVANGTQVLATMDDGSVYAVSVPSLSVECVAEPLGDSNAILVLQQTGDSASTAAGLVNPRSRTFRWLNGPSAAVQPLALCSPETDAAQDVTIAAAALHPLVPLLAVASSQGSLTLYNVQEQPAPIAFHPGLDFFEAAGPVAIQFDRTGERAAVVCGALLQVFAIASSVQLKLETAVNMQLPVQALQWSTEELSRGGVRTSLYVLMRTGTNSLVAHVPLSGQSPTGHDANPAAGQFDDNPAGAASKAVLPVALDEAPDAFVFSVPERSLSGLAVPPRELYQGNELVFSHDEASGALVKLSLPRRMALVGAGNAASSTFADGEFAQAVVLGDTAVTALEPATHVGASGTLVVLGGSQDQIVTASADGSVIVRHAVDLERVTVLEAVHDPLPYPFAAESASDTNGVGQILATRAGDQLVTMGARDNLVKKLLWRPGGFQQSSALQAAVQDAASFVQAQSERTAALTVALGDAASLAAPALPSGSVAGSQALTRPDTAVSDAPDLVASLISAAAGAVQAQGDDGRESEAVDPAASAATNAIQAKVSLLRERVSQLLAQNAAAPALEQLSPNEFVMDLEEHDRLQKLADAQVLEYRQAQERENARKTELRQRILVDCRDAMATTGSTVRSFLPDPLTGAVTTVNNFAVRRLSPREEQLLGHAALLRRTDVMVQRALAAFKGVAADALQLAQDDPEDASNSTTGAVGAWRSVAHVRAEELLYAPLEVVSDTRRRMQTQLLQLAAYELRAGFNAQFDRLYRAKRVEMSKIEEKNERMAEIMRELGISEPLFVPVLDDAEEPERLLVVADSELTSERVYSAEELAAMEQVKKAEAERARLAQSDNSHARGLQAMMGGKLEQATAAGAAPQLAPPPGLEKPKQERSEEEQKAVKEYERRVAAAQEEQEKLRRSHEAALRKLQGQVQASVAEFDEQTRAFFGEQLCAQQALLYFELCSRKLIQASQAQRSIEARAAALGGRLQQLRGERARQLAGLPEVKRELEKLREVLDSASRRDREVDRTLKKEFQVLPPADWAQVQRFYRERGDSGAVLPEAVDAAGRARVAELRERKIACEAEQRDAQRAFASMQQVVATRVDQCEQLRALGDAASRELQQIDATRFLIDRDHELLLQLKQGLVEVSQAPVVTNYAAALLVHRSAVEALNAQIQQVGKGKLDALVELRDYRKNIRRVEWDNAVLDFQAEDLQTRTRAIQLLRVTKQMQEFLHQGGGGVAGAGGVASAAAVDSHARTRMAQLERQAQYAAQLHASVLASKQRALARLEAKISHVESQSEHLEATLGGLEAVVHEREAIFNAGGGFATRKGVHANQALRQIQRRRQLADRANMQKLDLDLLEREAERLRLQTYPSFPRQRPAF